MKGLDTGSETTSYLGGREQRPQSVGQNGLGGSDGSRCASCSMTLSDDVLVGALGSSGKLNGASKDQLPLRTREEIHVCGTVDFGSEDDHVQAKYFSHSLHSMLSNSLCHSHSLEYVSSANPLEAETFSSLRRATVRTLSGEQLLRGQTAGPLWFGDSAAGYTIAYVFRLADLHARGRQRYYALLALAGSDVNRAFEACTLVWTFFEQIANHIMCMAEEVASRRTNHDNPPERGFITPITSFLTGRAMDPDGFPRQGVVSVRANGIAELVDNSNIFCELHMMFVSILQDLGRILGGTRIIPLNDEKVSAFRERVHSMDHEDKLPQETIAEPRPSEGAQNQASHSPTSLYGSVMTAHRRQVAV